MQLRCYARVIARGWVHATRVYGPFRIGLNNERAGRKADEPSAGEHQAGVPRRMCTEINANPEVVRTSTVIWSAAE
jgi:hypothetical protein